MIVKNRKDPNCFSRSKNKIRIKHGTLRKSLEFELAYVKTWRRYVLICRKYVVNCEDCAHIFGFFDFFFGMASERIPARIVLGQIHLGRQVKQREATAFPTHCYDMGISWVLVDVFGLVASYISQQALHCYPYFFEVTKLLLAIAIDSLSFTLNRFPHLF